MEATNKTIDMLNPPSDDVIQTNQTQIESDDVQTSKRQNLHCFSSINILNKMKEFSNPLIPSGIFILFEDFLQNK